MARSFLCPTVVMSLAALCAAAAPSAELLDQGVRRDALKDLRPEMKNVEEIIFVQRGQYGDRSQVEFHHLWVMDPDGTNQAIYYGNERSWDLFTYRPGEK